MTACVDAHTKELSALAQGPGTGGGGGTEEYTTAQYSSAARTCRPICLAEFEATGDELAWQAPAHRLRHIMCFFWFNIR